MGNGSKMAVLRRTTVSFWEFLGIPCNSENGGKRKPFMFPKEEKRRQEVRLKNGQKSSIDIFPKKT